MYNLNQEDTMVTCAEQWTVHCMNSADEKLHEQWAYNLYPPKGGGGREAGGVYPENIVYKKRKGEEKEEG